MRPYPLYNRCFRLINFLGMLLLLALLCRPAGVKGQQCPRQVRQYAVSQATQGNVTTDNDAVGGYVETASTLHVSGVLATSRQWLDFGTRIPANTRVYLKVSTLSGTVGLGTSFSIQAYYNGTGSTKPVVLPKLEAPQLLGLLSGDGTLEVSFVPEQDFDGVVVTVSGAVGVAYSMRVYEAYYLKTATSPMACNGVVDVLSGETSKLNALELVYVEDEWNAVDADLTSAAELFVGVGAVGGVYETVVFNTPSVPGDSVRIMIERPGASLLDLLLLGSFSIQPYLGSTAVGSPITNAGTGLQLRLLAPGSSVAILTAAVAGSFDRVEIRLNATAGVLLQLNLLDVTRQAPKPAVAFTLNNTPGPDPVCITQAGGISLSVTLPEACASYRWYNGTTFIGTGTAVTPPITAAGNYTFYVEAQRDGCTNTETQASVAVNVVPKSAPPALTIQNNP